MKSQELKKYLDFAYSAYQEHNITNQEYRQNGKVPYLFHSLWCASLLIADTDVPFKQRESGAKILLLHDVLEDTSLKIPSWVEPAVKKGVYALTLESGDLDEARIKIMAQSPFIKLLKLYDGLSSMYEKHVAVTNKHNEKWKKDRRRQWKKLARIVLRDVEKHYGNIRIVQIGKTIIKNTDW